MSAQAWTKAERDPCDQLTAVLHAAGVKLEGAEFVAGLGALIRKPQSVTTGSLTDIVGIGRATVNHSWHQVRPPDAFIRTDGHFTGAARWSARCR
jgi:hypothetical protein